LDSLNFNSFHLKSHTQNSKNLKNSIFNFKISFNQFKIKNQNQIYIKKIKDSNIFCQHDKKKNHLHLTFHVYLEVKKKRN